MDIIEKRVKPTNVELFEELTIKFAGDSGDGIQLVGQKYAELASVAGETVKTMPDFPAEIRAPAGSLGGVSGFQVRSGATGIFTHGDGVDMLLVMNPAALKRNLISLKKQGIIIVNQDTFSQKNLAKAEYQENPLNDGSLADFRVFPVSMTKLTMEALKDTGLSRKEKDRSKNLFALGLTCWLFSRPMAQVEDWIKRKFTKQPELATANCTVLNAGWNYAETETRFTTNFTIKKSISAPASDSTRFVTGNQAIALGLVKAARTAGIKLFLGGYPITPASEVMQELKLYRDDKVIVFQAEDEIAAVGAALGGSFAGALGATSTSGPGLALMSEFIDLAVMAELPLVIVDVQRAGPSTGIPTKTEQADLLQALWGRHGESPIPVLAATSPRDCFDMTIEAARIAIKYMTPVILMSDLYLSSSAEAWVEPDDSNIPQITPRFVSEHEPFAPYRRDPETLARAWAIPGSPTGMHIAGGLEKNGEGGAVSYDPADHEKMVNLRARKIAGIATDIDLPEVFGDKKADLLLIGWGSTYAAIMETTQKLNSCGMKVACIQIRHINPFPQGLGEVLNQFDKVLVVENNMGQLWTKLRAEYLLDLKKLSKVQGLPFSVHELTQHVENELIDSDPATQNSAGVKQ